MRSASLLLYETLLFHFLDNKIYLKKKNQSQKKIFFFFFLKFLFFFKKRLIEILNTWNEFTPIKLKNQYLKNNDLIKLKKLLGKDIKLKDQKIEKVKFEEDPKSNFKLLSCNPTKVANQITLIISGIFQKVEAYEFSQRSWQKQNRSNVSPSLSAMIYRFNKLAYWVNE